MIFIAIGQHVVGYLDYDDIGHVDKTSIIKFAAFTLDELNMKMKSYCKSIEFGIEKKAYGIKSIEDEFIYVEWIFISEVDYESTKLLTENWNIDKALYENVSTYGD